MYNRLNYFGFNRVHLSIFELLRRSEQIFVFFIAQFLTYDHHLFRILFCLYLMPLNPYVTLEIIFLFKEFFFNTNYKNLFISDINFVYFLHNTLYYYFQ